MANPEGNRGDALGRAEFLYLDQEAVIAAGVLDMRRAIGVVREAQASFARGEAREPHKVVLRNADTAESEEQGRHHNKNGKVRPVFEEIRSAQNDRAHERDEICRGEERAEGVKKSTAWFPVGK